MNETPVDYVGVDTRATFRKLDQAELQLKLSTAALPISAFDAS